MLVRRSANLVNAKPFCICVTRLRSVQLEGGVGLPCRLLSSGGSLRAGCYSAEGGSRTMRAHCERSYLRCQRRQSKAPYCRIGRTSRGILIFFPGGSAVESQRTSGKRPRSVSGGLACQWNSEEKRYSEPRACREDDGGSSPAQAIHPDRIRLVSHDIAIVCHQHD